MGLAVISTWSEVPGPLSAPVPGRVRPVVVGLFSVSETLGRGESPRRRRGRGRGGRTSVGRGLVGRSRRSFVGYQMGTYFF